MTVQGSTSRNVRTPAGEISYTLLLEQLPLRHGGAVVGSMSAFSYVVEGGARDRPILFLTNGGPGSGSAFLHLSGIGPKRASVPRDVTRGVAAPYGVEDSASTLLDTADLVFLDAPATGMGQLDPEGATAFYGMEPDAEAIARAIAHWCRIHRRWDAPKFFLGESYGTHRAAMLATAVHDADAMPLDGIILLGQAVNIQEVSERPGNVVGALANLPYKAAVAHYHGLGSNQHVSVHDAVQAALDYAWTDLALAMLQGTALPEAELQRVAGEVSAMIGVPAAELEDSRLWISKPAFRERLLRDQGLTLGSNDSRYASPSVDGAAGESPIDATSTHLTPRYAIGLQSWLAEAFSDFDPGEYRFFDPLAAQHWDWSDSGARRLRFMGQPSPFDAYPYAAKLSRWMKQAPEARLMIGTGLYDSLTTVGAADHLVRQWDLPRDRVTERWYEGGHMMYSVPAVADILNDDLRDFITKGAA